MSSFVEGCGCARNARFEHEHATGERHLCEFGFTKSFPQLGHVHCAPILPSEARHGRVRDGQPDVGNQLAGRTEAIDAASGDAAAPVAAFLIGRAAVRATPLGQHFHKHFAFAKCASFHIVGMAKDRPAARIRVIQGASVRAPGQARPLDTLTPPIMRVQR